MTLRSSSSRGVSPRFLELPLSLLLAAAACAQTPLETHAKIQLVSEEKSIRPSGSFWVGILFQLDPGWHIYWQNPGDSGEPPKIEWRLPAGFRAGEIRWPWPIRLGTNSIRDYGYEGQVLLMASIDVPTNLNASTPVPIAATAKYIVCREICIPGRSDVKLLLPISEATNIETTGWSELFKNTRARVPKPLPPELKVWADSVEGNFILSFQALASQRQIRFFPLEPGVIENAAPQQLSSNGKVMRLTLKKFEQLTKAVSVLRGVIVLDEDRAYEVSVPVKSS